LVNPMSTSCLVFLLLLHVCADERGVAAQSALISNHPSPAAVYHSVYIFSSTSHLLCQIVVCGSRCVVSCLAHSCSALALVLCHLDLFIVGFTTTITTAPCTGPSDPLRHYLCLLMDCLCVFVKLIIKRV